MIYLINFPVTYLLISIKKILCLKDIDNKNVSNIKKKQAMRLSTCYLDIHF